MTDWFNHRAFKFPGDIEYGLRELDRQGRFAEVPEEMFLRWCQAVKDLEFASEMVRDLLAKRP